MSKAQLKKFLKELDRDQLEEFVLDMYTDIKPVKAYLDFFLNPDVDKLVDKTQLSLFTKIFRPNGDPVLNLKFTKINDIMKEFTMKVRDAHIVADMMVYLLTLLCEYGSQYCHTESFVKSVVANFSRLSKWLIKNGLEKEYYDKMNSLIRQTHSIGWGCTDWVYNSIDPGFD